MKKHVHGGTDAKVLSTKVSIGGVATGLPIMSNDKQVCLRCNEPITPENDSGWEAFLPNGRTTQPECISCHEESLKITAKSED